MWLETCIGLLITYVACLENAYTKDARQMASLELERAVIKPPFCGAEYFNGLSRKAIYDFPKATPSSTIDISGFCRKFSAENEVELNILDAWGNNLCQYRNSIANYFRQIYAELNLRDTDERFAIYTHFYDLFATTPTPFFPPPSTSDPYFDFWGVVYILVYAQVGNAVTPVWGDSFILERINIVINYIKTYSVAGYQSIQAIEGFSKIATLISSINGQAQYSAYNRILNLLGNEGFSSRSEIYNDVQFIGTMVVNSYVISVGSPFIYYPISQAYERLARQVEITKIVLGSAGIYKAMGIPLVVNGMEDGICRWAFNYVSPLGSNYRFIFSQSKRILLLKK